VGADRHPGDGEIRVSRPIVRPPGAGEISTGEGTCYIFEYRIPWSALNSSRAPRRGETLTACIQCHWGTEKGDDLLCGTADVRVDSAKMAAMPESWGWAVFE
jgi:hypothetical protein